MALADPGPFSSNKRRHAPPASAAYPRLGSAMRARAGRAGLGRARGRTTATPMRWHASSRAPADPPGRRSISTRRSIACPAANKQQALVPVACGARRPVRHQRTRARNAVARQRQRVNHPIPQYPTRREAANVVGSASTTAISRSPSSPSSFPPARHRRLRQASRCFSMCLPARRSRTLTHVVMDRQLQITPIDR